MIKNYVWGILFGITVCIYPKPVYAMHIAEGFLPLQWALFWWIVIIPFLYMGIKQIKKIVLAQPEAKIILGLAGAFAFILSALKLPSVTGSSSHPTGVGLGTILFGPTVMTVLGTIVLIFQALLLAHGGISTLGANVFSLAVVGPFTAFALYKLLTVLKLRRNYAVFVAASLGNLMTYVTTSIQLALAHPGESLLFAFGKFLGIFAYTQVPLAVIEGLLTVLVINMIHTWDFNLNITGKEVGVQCTNKDI